MTELKKYRMRGLAWDDEPSGYMADLRKALQRMEIDLEVAQSEEQFYDRFNNGRWKFVVTDLLNERFDPPKRTGVDIARNVSADRRADDPWFPIFVVTQFPGELSKGFFSSLPANAYARYKMDPYWMAILIRDELRLRGVYTNPRKTFLVHSLHDDAFPKYGEPVQKWLESHGQEVILIGRISLNVEILHGLLKEMNECAAIIAVCTPDDSWQDGSQHPRQNVIMEIGMALGSSGGLRRLTMLKHESAILPSDVGGVLTFNFKHSSVESDVVSRLETRLLDLGVDLSPAVDSKPSLNDQELPSATADGD